jgi:REP element-mobilizing transposase RayT
MPAGDERVFPLAYHITFTCYGHRLHGADSGSVDREHHVPHTPLLPANQTRVRSELKRMADTPYQLGESTRNLVLEAVREVCAFRAWLLLVVHVRATHIHVVVRGRSKPEPIMNSFKAYATRKLNESGLERARRRRWARHGSTKYLWDVESVLGAIDYALDQQGDRMAVFVDAEAIRKLRERR